MTTTQGDDQDLRGTCERRDSEICASDCDAIVIEVPHASLALRDAQTALRTPLLVVLSGPSGAGKDAVLDELTRRGQEFHRVLTCTTRPPRKSERNGIDYRFVSDEEFDELIATGRLFEHARVYSHRSGVPRQQVIEKLSHGIDVIVRTDIQGAATIKEVAPGAVLIFIAPTSLNELEERIRARGADDEDQVQCRLRTAVSEMSRRDECDYVVVNEPGRLDATVSRVREILERERLRPRLELAKISFG